MASHPGVPIDTDDCGSVILRFSNAAASRPTNSGSDIATARTRLRLEICSEVTMVDVLRLTPYSSRLC
jgi:hypothetical protein